MSTFHGVIVPMVTPFKRDSAQSINFCAADQLIEKLIGSGVSGIFIFGSNGEFHLCSHEERIRFTKHVVQKVGGRLPVYVGTGACSTNEACNLSREAEALGADALSVVNPYFTQISDSEIVRYYERVAASVKIPIILYNIPKSTGMNLSAEVVSKIAPIENIKGIKDSSGNVENLAGYIEAAYGNDMDVLVGSDGKISKGYAMGATGAIAGTANLITDVVVGLFSALESGKTESAKMLQAEIEPLRDILHKGSTPAVLKRSLELAGIPVGPAREPVSDLSGFLDASIMSMLDHYGIEHI
ncbi:dihydrodipicolinate synthetase [Coriobacterium glomerans PW2]|uniref:Dihydrodipicolinate synthetase n=1 Tax=Coriobacterium glomerans (strain ATCC 49209 / DSM 20642 / JCM 10262 / PW2) TaxID=700015 RepID=F2NAW7_CORGP|nr:dihydrodipicolinate synthase family protein [Coriobacterium glomerans]AEB07645.1 dihydrodipicolinate synthetase [Coriobacterium glomerans PW2]